MLSLPRVLSRRRARGTRIEGHRIESAGDTRERVASALGPDHPCRAAALKLCYDLAVLVLASADSSPDAGARRGQPARLSLTIAPGAVRIEARGAGIDGAAPDRTVADRLATRWGITHHAPAGSTLWFALGPPIDGGEGLLER